MLSPWVYAPVSGTIATRTKVEPVSVPWPIRCRLIVFDVPQPAERVVLPLSPGAKPTMVIAGLLPVPP